MSSMWTSSAECETQPFPMDRELVFTLSICFLNHFLSSRIMISCLLLMLVSMCEKED